MRSIFNSEQLRYFLSEKHLFLHLEKETETEMCAGPFLVGYTIMNEHDVESMLHFFNTFNKKISLLTTRKIN